MDSQGATATATAVDACIALYANARTDEERFAALLLMARALPPSDPAALDRAYAAVGTSFVHRLLTATAPAECGPLAFKEVGVAVLAVFVDAPIAQGDAAIAAELPAVFAVLAQSDVTEPIAAACVHIIGAVLSAQPPPAGLPSPAPLCRAVSQWPSLAREGAAAIAHLLQSADTPWLAAHADDVRSCMELLTALFVSASGADKFALAECVAAAAGKVSSLAQPTALWAATACRGFADVMRNKMGTEQKASLLRLAASMCAALGADWLVRNRVDTPGAPSGEKLLVLTVHASCIEVRMALEDRDAAQAARESATVLCSALVVLEAAVEWLVAREDLGPLGMQMHRVLREAYAAVLAFVAEAALLPASPGIDLVVRACLRALAAWLAEETEALRVEAQAALPCIVGWCDGRSNFESFGLLLPALVNLTADARGSAAVVEGGLHMLQRFILFRLRDLSAESACASLAMAWEVAINLAAHEADTGDLWDAAAATANSILQSGGQFEWGVRSKIVAGILCVARRDPYEVLGESADAFLAFAAKELEDSLGMWLREGAEQPSWDEVVTECWPHVMGDTSHASPMPDKSALLSLLDAALRRGLPEPTAGQAKKLAQCLRQGTT